MGNGNGILQEDGTGLGRGQRQARIKLAGSMLIFGTIGAFVRHIPLPSGMIACARGFIGMVSLLFFVLAIRRERLSLDAIRKNLLPLFLSGGFLGINWVLLFEGMKHTTVATATLCYYFAPIFVIFVSPVFFKERLTKRKLLCSAAAICGMVFVSGVLETGGTGRGDFRGVLFSLGAAAFYASVILSNKKLREVPSYKKTIVQLGAAAIVLVPYILLTEDTAAVIFTPQAALMLLVVGVLHTGVTYALYFGSMKELEAQSVAFLSYIDPVVAVLTSALVLKEHMGVLDVAGAFLVLGSALLSETAGSQT